MRKSVFSYLNFASFLTSLNIVCGIASIYFAIQGNFFLAGTLILCGVIFDTLDGIYACKLEQETDFGAEYDSLSDLISFGVAPMVMVVTYFENPALNALSMLIPLAGALRLARYNVTRHQTKGFLIGLPIGASGIAIPVLIAANAHLVIVAIVIAAIPVLYLSTFRINKVMSKSRYEGTTETHETL